MSSGCSIDVPDVSYVILHAGNYRDFFMNIGAHMGGLFENV